LKRLVLPLPAVPFPPFNVVEQDMDKSWRDEIAILKAQLAVQQMALRALAHTCPEPAALLDEWRKLRADTVAAAYALLPDIRSSEWLTEHVQAFAEDWTAELVDIVTLRVENGDPPTVSAAIDGQSTGKQQPGSRAARA
jgi:hypothetical protein